MKLMVYAKRTTSYEVEPPLSLPTISTAERDDSSIHHDNIRDTI